MKTVRAVVASPAPPLPLRELVLVAGGGLLLIIVTTATIADVAERVRLPAIVLAAVAATACDDPAEHLTASTPIARPTRWTRRGLVTGSTAIALATLTAVISAAATGWSPSDPMVTDGLPIGDLVTQVAAYVAVGLAAAAWCIRTTGPGRSALAGPIGVVAAHMVLANLGVDFLVPDKVDIEPIVWWSAWTGLGTLVFLLGARDPGAPRPAQRTGVDR